MCTNGQMATKVALNPESTVLGPCSLTEGTLGSSLTPPGDYFLSTVASKQGPLCTVSFGRPWAHGPGVPAGPSFLPLVCGPAPPQSPALSSRNLRLPQSQPSHRPDSASCPHIGTSHSHPLLSYLPTSSPFTPAPRPHVTDKGAEPMGAKHCLCRDGHKARRRTLPRRPCCSVA